MSPGILFAKLNAWIRANGLPSKAAIEDVHSLYGMSAKSNFNFGYNVGAARAILEALMPRVEIHTIQPKRWQQGVGLTAKGKEIKNAVGQIAHRLYPRAEIFGPKGGLMDGRADALMIAHYISKQG